MKGLGKKLKYYRENCELSQQQVANALNVDRSTYTYYETGKTNPDSYALIKLADYFGVTIDYLVGRTDNNIFNRNDARQVLENIQRNIDDLKLLL